MCSWSGECEARVETVMFRLPPSALNPAATAMASTSVDLPLPFSPAKSVTFGWNCNSPSVPIAGIEYGYRSKFATWSRLSWSDRRKGSGTARV